MEPIHFTVNPASDDAMLKLWKITCNTSGITMDEMPQGTSRINNRTWRLLNRKLVLKQETHLKTHDLKQSFLNNVPTTLENRVLLSNSSNLSLGSEKKSTQSSSIISNDDKKEKGVAFHLQSHDNHEEDEGYHEDESDTEHDKAVSPKTDHLSPKGIQPKSNIFYIGNSPSPCTSKENNHGQILKLRSSIDTSNEMKHATMQRQGSLFSNFGFSQDTNNDSRSHTEKPGDSGSDDDDDGYSSTDISEDEEPLEETDEEDEEQAMPSSKSRDDNESEWLSVSSESNHSAEHPPPPLNFHKVDPLPIAVQGKRTSAPLLQKPRSLLSGLFLNEMARTNSVPPPPEKPQLLRSRTTGIFHIENQMENNKPSIVFTNKFPSSTELTTSEEGTPVPMVKQETIVAVSDVNAISTTDHKEQDHARLSTSLNKISRSLSHHSFRNLLSRSQLNLTKMYQKPKPKPESIKQPTPQVQQPVKLSPSYSPPVPIVPRRPVTTTTIELKPNDKLLDESLSASLKKALSIDYKLGKVPLPERVIDDRAIVAGPGGGSLDSDFDDYHSKGW